MEDKELHGFLDFYSAQLINDSKRCIRRSEFKFFSDPTNANVVQDSRDFYYRDYQDQVKEVEMEYDRMCVLEISEHALKHLINLHQRFYNRSPGSGHPEMARTIIEKEWAEHQLRSQHPAVQSAWEHYSLMLHLASNGKELD
jgi:hypothetical protein